MNPQANPPPPNPPNGAGAAALLAAGLGAASLGLLSLLADKLPSTKPAFTLYHPTGPLSGVTTAAVLFWLAAWALLHWQWNNRSVPIRPVLIAAFLALLAGLLLTFPPFADFL